MTSLFDPGTDGRRTQATNVGSIPITRSNSPRVGRLSSPVPTP